MLKGAAASWGSADVCCCQQTPQTRQQPTVTALVATELVVGLPAELPAAAPPFFTRSNRPMSAVAAAGWEADLLLVRSPEGRAAVVTAATGLPATGDLFCVGDDALGHPLFVRNCMQQLMAVVWWLLLLFLLGTEGAVSLLRKHSGRSDAFACYGRSNCFESD